MNKKLVIIIAIGIIGIFRIMYLKWENERDNKILNDFGDKFNKLNQSINTNNFDNNIYSILMRKSEEIQDLLGHHGIIATYQASRYDHIYYNYQVIVNEIPKIRHNYSNLSNFTNIGSSCIGDSINLIEDSLLKKSGGIEKLNNIYTKELKNPLIWLRNGIQFVVTLPILMIYWSGLMKYQSYVTITNNFFVKSISFVIGMVELYGTAVTIVTGNQLFQTKIAPYFQTFKLMWLSIFTS